MEELETIDGYGVCIQVGDAETFADSSVFIDLPPVTAIGSPTETADQTETTNAKSANRRKTFKPQFVDSGELTFTVQANAAALAQLRALKFQPRGYRVLLEQNGTNHSGGFGVNGFISSYTEPIDIKNIVTIDITIKLSGDVVPIDPNPAA